MDSDTTGLVRPTAQAAGTKLNAPYLDAQGRDPHRVLKGTPRSQGTRVQPDAKPDF